MLPIILEPLKVVLKPNVYVVCEFGTIVKSALDKLYVSENPSLVHPVQVFNFAYNSVPLVSSDNLKGTWFGPIYTSI